MSNIKLASKDIKNIRKKILSWHGKFTWDGLVLAIKSDLGIIISRQALKDYTEVYNEYLRRKAVGRGVVSVSDAPITVADSDTISKLQKDLANSQAEAEMYKRDYNKAQIILNRVIVNAQSIPNLDVSALFAEIDSTNDN